MIILCFNENDIQLGATGGTIVNFIKQSGNYYTAKFLPKLDSATNLIDAEYLISVPANKFIDSAGNYNLESNIFKWILDTTSPTMTISAVDFSLGDKISYDIIKLLFTSSEDTENFNAVFSSFQDYFWDELEARYWDLKHGPITIAIFSNLGRHRSRAMARLLDYIFFRIGGFTVEDPIHHLSKGDCGWWDCPHGCCHPGGAASREKTDLLDQAYRRYIHLQNSHRPVDSF